MPSSDTHYWLMGCLAKDSGLDRFRAEEVAWASQMMDEMTPEWCAKNDAKREYGLKPTQCYDFDWWKEKRVFDPRESIWEAHHFPQQIAVQPMLEYLSGGFIEGEEITAGLRLHTIMDALCSHKYFLPYRSEKNRSKGHSRSFVEWITGVAAPPIGHAEYGSDVDDIDEFWTTPAGLQVHNKNDWHHALVRIYEQMGLDPTASVAVTAVDFFNDKKKRIEFMREESGIRPFAQVDKERCPRHKARCNLEALALLSDYFAIVSYDATEGKLHEICDDHRASGLPIRC